MSDSADSIHPENSLPPLASAVYIVGAGPGDPDLLTVKAQKILQRADVIVFADSLVPKQILQGTRPDAEIVRTGNKTLEEIVPLMIERVRSHKSVVRLHSGDLSLYSAIHEQMQALAEAEIPFEVIPGISAFQAAAAKLGVELTVPGLVQTIILTRISGRASAVPESEELASLAAHQASLCLYLSARHVEEAQAKLLEHYPADTPVAICFRIGWPDEQIWLVSLDKMATVTQEKNLIRTTLYLISPALETVGKGRMQAMCSTSSIDLSETPPELAVASKEIARSRSMDEARSRLYHPEHSHLFRPSQTLS